MKKIVFAVIFVLVALIPTYLILFNTLNASGLPDFKTQAEVEVTFPATAEDPNHKINRYTKDSNEFRLLTAVLSYLTPVSALPEGVSSAAYYQFTFVNEKGVSNACRLYTDPDEFRTYLTSSQGKVFRLATPFLLSEERHLFPTFVQYAIPDVEGPRNTSRVVEYVGDYTALDFTTAPDSLTIHAYLADGETLLGTYHAFADVPAAAEFVTVAAEFTVTDGLFYRVGYAIRKN